MDLQTNYRRNPELLAVDMDGEKVMMDMESGNYFGINTVGSHIWDALETENNVASILEVVKFTYDVPDEDTLQNDVANFLADMVEQKLVEAVN